jgi:hypothetical protein
VCVSLYIYNMCVCEHFELYICKSVGHNIYSFIFILWFIMVANKMLILVAGAYPVVARNVLLK